MLFGFGWKVYLHRKMYRVCQNSLETTNVRGVAGDFYFGSANQRVELNLRL